MKRVIKYLLPMFLAASCSQPADLSGCNEEEVPVSLFVTTSELEYDDPATKSLQPLDPVVENTIENLWILQYSNDGRLIKADYKELGNPMMSISLKTSLAKSSNSTVVIIANMGGVHTVDPEWPSSSAFKWGSHGGGSLFDLQNKLFECSSVKLDSQDFRHLYLTGITNIDVVNTDDTPSINVMLSRLACKIKVSIKSLSPDTYSNVRLQILDNPSKLSLFPVEFNLSDEDYNDFSIQQVCTAGEYLGTASFKSFYFYTTENLTSIPEKQTMLKILAVKDGHEVSNTVPVSSQGATYRNTYYNIQITLK